MANTARFTAIAVIAPLLLTIATIAVAEIALRLLWVPPSLRSDDAFEAHSVYRNAPIPGASGVRVTSEYEHAFAHSDQGLRADRNFTRERPTNTRHRVLFLGDSFTYGLGSEATDSFVGRLSSSWPDVEIINAGTNGYGQREQLAVLDQLGAVLEPDLVVLMFFWNDLEDNQKRDWPDFSLAADGRVARRDKTIENSFDPLALRSSDGTPRGNPWWKTFYLEKLIKEGTQGLRYRLFGIKPRFIQTTDQRQAAWETTAALLNLVKMRTSELGARLLVISIPDHNLVNPDAVIKGIEPINFEIEDQLGRVCDTLGLDCFDPLPAMQREHQRSSVPLYYYADRHLTPEGNAALARIISPLIRRSLEEREIAER